MAAAPVAADIIGQYFQIGTADVPRVDVVCHTRTVPDHLVLPRSAGGGVQDRRIGMPCDTPRSLRIIGGQFLYESIQELFAGMAGICRGPVVIQRNISAGAVVSARRKRLVQDTEGIRIHGRVGVQIRGACVVV